MLGLRSVVTQDSSLQAASDQNSDDLYEKAFRSGLRVHEHTLRLVFLPRQKINKQEAVFSFLVLIVLFIQRFSQNWASETQAFRTNIVIKRFPQ